MSYFAIRRPSPWDDPANVQLYPLPAYIGDNPDDAMQHPDAILIPLDEVEADIAFDDWYAGHWLDY